VISAVNGDRGDDAKVATVAVIGPLPPPSHGHMVFTQRLLESQLLARRFRLVHVDISDHRELGTVGRLELVNVLLALRHFGRLIKVLATERPDIVHVPLAQNLLGLGRDLVLVAISLLGRAKVVGQVHGGGLGTFLSQAPRWFTALARVLLHRCSALVVMTRWQAERLGPALPAERTVVIPHGTEDNPSSPAEPRPDRFRALYVSSHLHESKGLEALVAAATRAQAAGVTTEWEIFGEWLDETTRIETQRRVGEVPGIHFRGAVERSQLAPVYSNADAFVFPAGPSEGFALVRIEAMAAGLPVITTEAGGGREIVRDGVEGFIVDVDDPDQIVDRLKQLREDPRMHAQIARRAQARQRSEYAEQAFETSMADLWEAAAGGKVPADSS
jgi:glycosyltransferase involved in cell wall biosynthesis